MISAGCILSPFRILEEHASRKDMPGKEHAGSIPASCRNGTLSTRGPIDRDDAG
jgi:hypothetical protein